MASDYERKILEFYQLQTPFPTAWPADKNDADSSDEEQQPQQQQQDDAKKRKLYRRKSRYQALERAVSTRRSFIPGSEQAADKSVGPNLVAKDEPDPLGTTDSVVRTLRNLGLLTKEDTKMRNRFLLSSTTFQPAAFLSQVHANADTDSLLTGLDVLARSIDQKSASLKVLVETNFERFVKAKATIDNVYREMKYRGAEPPAAATTGPMQPPPSAAARARAPSLHAGRASFRASISGGVPAPGAPIQPPPLPHQNPHQQQVDSARKKNALIKESEYGVIGIKVPLLDVTAKAEDVWGPALGGREREEHLKTVTAQMDRFREYVELSSAIADSIRRRDYESLVEEYTRARRFAEMSRELSRDMGKVAPTDPQLYQILLAARIWFDVDEQMQAFRRDIWRRLISVQHMSRVAETGVAGPDQHMELIALLLELGVEDNPIWMWLLARYDFLKTRIGAVADRARVEIEVLRRRLAASGGDRETSGPQSIAPAHLQSWVGRQQQQQALETAGGRVRAGAAAAALDSADVIELWDRILAFLTGLLGSGQVGAGPGTGAAGLLGEVVEFWQTVQGFVDGRTQRSLPLGYNGESRHHHQLSASGIADLSKGAVELVDMIRDHVYGFFAGPPPEDISLLYSPLPPSPGSAPPVSAGGGSGRSHPLSPLSPLSPRDPRFNIDPSTAPPSPHGGELDKFAFWPPWSNSVSGIHYLARMLTLVGTAAAEMASIPPVARSTDGPAVLDRLRGLVGTSRERCVIALCHAWKCDAQNIKHVEDWRRAGASEVSRMPAVFATFEGALLAGMQKILYISEAMSRPGAETIVLPPQSKLLQLVRSHYVTTLYKALSGMVENAERPVRKAEDEWTTADGGGVGDGFTAVAGAMAADGDDGRSTLDPSDRNVRMLLTLSNLQALRVTVVPTLNSQFENAFSVKLTDESKTIKDVLDQIDASLFKSYTRSHDDRLRATIRSGISDPAWAPPVGTRPTGVRPYVYEALLGLVLVHSQVSGTAPALTVQVLSYLLERLTEHLLEAFRLRPRYPLEALMQATLDVEFVAQTLAQYTTGRASELQSQIYSDLDGRTDNDARTRLQGELPEMRNLLKRLREASRNEFSCFRKPKRQGSGGGPAAAQQSGPAGGSNGIGAGRIASTDSTS